MLPNLNSLECFVAAAELPSFRAAAARVALSPAAFSARIRQLEEQLDAQLFHRSTRHVALSEAGKRLLPVAQACLEQAQHCVAVVRADNTPMPYTLTLGTRYELGLSWLVPALDPLRAAQPERQIQLRFGDSDHLLEEARSGRIDALVSSIRLTSAGFSYAVLHQEDYVFVASPTRLAQRPLSEPGQARQHTLVDAAADRPLFRYFLDALPGTEDWPFAHTEVMGTIAAVRARILSGAAVGVLPAYFAREALAAGQLVPLFTAVEPSHDAFRLIWRAGHPREAQLRALAEALVRIPLR
jgi:DNA-binding transcriptional LysR family regulator